MYCNNCGKQISNQDKICPECKHLFEQEKIQITSKKIKGSKTAFILGLIGGIFTGIDGILWFDKIESVTLIAGEEAGSLLIGLAFSFLISAVLGIIGSFKARNNEKKGYIFFLISALICLVCFLSMLGYNLTSLAIESFIVTVLFGVAFIFAKKKFNEK